MGIGLKRAFFRFLDRKGGRRILASICNASAIAIVDSKLSFFFDRGRWFHRYREVVFPGSATFAYDPASFRELIQLESKYVRDATDHWMHFYMPSAGDTVIDVGAGRGEDVLAFSRATGSKGRVFALEALPDTFAALKEFCEANHLLNVTPINIAVSDSPGAVSFTEEKDWVGTSVSLDSNGKLVEADRLSDICTRQGIGRIDYLKMNIEGAERQALIGLTPIIENVMRICVSCHDFRSDRGDGEHFRTREFVWQYLLSHGYQVHLRDDPRPHVRDQIYGTRVV